MANVMPNSLSISDDVRARAAAIRDSYAHHAKSDNFTVLIMGLFGVGKTTFITTGPRPILIDSFDPKGTVLLNRLYPDEIAKGDILVREYWDESSRSPKAYSEWEKQWEEDIRTGFLNHFGTYAIDSMTTWIDSIAHKVSKMQGRPNASLAISDYPIIYNVIKDVIKKTSTQHCNFILTAHLVEEQDDITGAVEAQIKSYKSLKSDIPLLFTEKYVLRTVNKADKVVHELLVKSAGRFKASTQLGAGGTLNNTEEPNLKKIMAKVGMDITDKPSLFGGVK